MQVIHLKIRCREILLGTCLRSLYERYFTSQVHFLSVDMLQISVSSSLKFGRHRTSYTATVAHPFNYTLKQLEVHSLSETRGRKYNQQVRSCDWAAKHTALMLHWLWVCLSSLRIAEPEIILESVKSTKCCYCPVSKPPALFPSQQPCTFSIHSFWMGETQKWPGTSQAMNMRHFLSIKQWTNS